MTESERETIFAAARKVLLAALPDARAIYVYGSFARGDEWPSSDMDLGVLLTPGERIPDLLSLIVKVSDAVKRDVDLVNLREVGFDLIHDVLRDGRLLFTRDADELLGWEAERMTDYAEFSPRRADLVAMYMREPLLPPA